MAFEEMPELTAARIIASLNEEIDEKDTQIEDLTTQLDTTRKYKNKAVDQAASLTSENNLLRDAGKTYMEELAKTQIKVRDYEKVRDLQADAIDRLNGNIGEWKAKSDKDEAQIDFLGKRLAEEARANHYSWKQRYDELLAKSIVQNFCPTCGQPDNCGDCDHYMATDPQPDFLIKDSIITDLQENLKSAYAENESLRYRLRSISNSVEMHVKGV